MNGNDCQCAWVQFPFDAAAFTASGSMTWTVEAADVVTFALTRIGRTVIVSFEVTGTTLGGTASTEVRLALPSAVVPLRGMSNNVRLFDGGTGISGYAHVNPNGTYIRVTKLDASNLTLGTNVFGLQGQIAFEAASWS